MVRMFLGHYAVAFVAKRLVPNISLGTMILAAQLMDILWPIFLLLGIEHVAIQPGITAASSFNFYDYPYSHSLLGSLIWSAVLGLVFFALRRSPKGALAVGGVVFSHWLLDLIVHRPDLPLSLTDGPYFGLGVWSSLPLTLGLELGLLGVGVITYLRASTPRDRLGKYMPFGLVVLLVLVYVGTLSGPAPNVQTVAVSGFIFICLTVAFGYWIDRHRRGDGHQ